MANALKTLFGDIAQAIRDQNGDPPEVKYKPAEFPQKIADITGGGGSSADVRYVTFMSEDGSFEYGKKAVAVGDNCADPIARGVFSKPTKESTAQYSYTHYGWATIPNGAADSNWNKSITEDKTVYANFAAVVRYYTITYYDGDTVKKTESLAYGSMPDYALEKSGYTFDGWEPTLTTVTEDANYYAKWSEAITFANGAWEDIVDICNAGNAEQYFKLGDSRVIPITLSNGNSYDERFTIIGFNHDNKEDGTKANISVISEHCFHNVAFGGSGAPGITSGWKNSAARSTLNSNAYARLPEKVRTAIKPVVKLSSGSPATTLDTTIDKLWVPSFVEYGGSPGTTTVSGQGEKYEYMGRLSLKAGGFNANGPTGYIIPHTSRTYYTSGNVACVDDTGGLTSMTPTYVSSYRFGFCI